MYEKIKSLCDEKGVKIATLCKDAGISKSILSELKCGRTKSLSTQTLLKISQYFGVQIEYFTADGDTDEESRDDSIRDELFRKRKLLFDMSKNATEEQLDTFLVMFKALFPEEDK